MGSKDRKLMAALTYCFFRLGKSFNNKDWQGQLVTSIIMFDELHTDAGFEILYDLPGGDGIDIQKIKKKLPLNERLNTAVKLLPSFSPNQIFPFRLPLSGKNTFIDAGKNMLVVPFTWIRVKKKYKNAVVAELKSKNINYRSDASDSLTLGFEARVNLTQLEVFEKGFFEIQDKNSQLSIENITLGSNSKIWDCCCGAGGKSLQLSEKFPGSEISATDIRPSIIKNLKMRAAKAEVTNIKSFVLDIELPFPEYITSQNFDLILVDVPCSGSGTWSRHPENLLFFRESDAAKYVCRQQRIMENLAKFCKPGTKVVYITCSLFRCENEEIIDYCIQQLNIQCITMNMLDGSASHADTMFYAELIIG
jgi:16S rRNA (cytosine967-C5)-methyltransferase